MLGDPNMRLIEPHDEREDYLATLLEYRGLVDMIDGEISMFST